jgi:hypothetical protein
MRKSIPTNVGIFHYWRPFASLLAKGFRNESKAKLEAFYCNTDQLNNPFGPHD